MPDLEMVITALQHCIHKPCHTNCPYFSSDDPTQAYCLFNKIMPDALALLKKQEPRVMTVEEINKRAESLDPDPVFVQWRETGGTAWVVRSVNIIAGMVNAGNRSVRAWTSRPTPEQMLDTKWEEDVDAE